MIHSDLIKFKATFLEALKTLAVFLIGFILIRMLATPVFVHGESMMPTLVHGDWVIAEKISNIFSQPKKNDIIVFINEEKNQHLIKRVIGVPGDKITIEGNYFFVNGELLEDAFMEQILSIGDTIFPVTVDDNSYFVLGDNRNKSKDSTYVEVGLVGKDKIVGNAIIRVYPFNKLKILN